MNCLEFEMKIYLYGELSEKEQRQVDVHLSSCLQCSALFQEVTQAHQLIRRVAEEKEVPAHAARLTGNIMSKIKQRSTRKGYAWVSNLLLSQPAKYMLSASSSLLLLVFFSQSVGNSPKIEMGTNKSLANSVILNAKVFRDNFSHNKAKQALFADCRSPFHSNQYYLNCIKSKLK